MVIVWDIATDAKTNLIEHESNICYIKFSEDGQHLFTLDGGLTPSICLWVLSGSLLLQHLYLPQKARRKPIKNCIAKDSMASKLILVLENEEEGYRVSCWDFSRRELSFMFVMELESEAICHEFNFSKTLEAVFYTAENIYIKVWKIDSTGIKQIQRIHLPQKIAQVSICDLSGAFVALSLIGTVFVLSAEVIIS